MEEVVAKMDSSEVGKGNKKSEKLETTKDDDARSKKENKESVDKMTKEVEKVFDAEVKIAHANMDSGEVEEVKTEAKKEVEEEAARKIQGLSKEVDTTDEKGSMENISSDKKGSSEIEKVFDDKNDSLDKLEGTEDEKCCGFMGIEAVGGR